MIVSVGPNFFYTVTLPCTLWFFDKGKCKTPRQSPVHRCAQHLPAIDRAHRDFLPEQIEFLANIVRLWREQEPEQTKGSLALVKEHGLANVYADVLGLCKAPTLREIEAQGWRLNPGRYVGALAHDAEDEDFRERVEELQEELEALNAEAATLQTRIAQNVAELLQP